MTPITFVAHRLQDVGRSLQRAGAGVLPLIVGAAADLVVLSGIAAIAYGIWLMHHPSAWIFAGAVAVIVGIRGSQPPRQREDGQ